MKNNRWWENYLVRYFVPSIAGMVLVGIIATQQQENIAKLLPRFLITEINKFETAHLVLWLLLGTLYCYIASYPILCFHATRVLDFQRIPADDKDIKDITGLSTKNELLNPYLWTAVYALAIYAIYIFFKEYFFDLGLICTILFALLQMYRLYKAYSSLGLFTRKTVVKKTAAYAYMLVLSNKRGPDTEDSDSDDQNKTVSRPRVDIDSYKHLREHGNTAFIIFLEVAIFPSAYWCVKNFKVWELALLIGVWVFPAMLTHYFAQHLEFSFSQYKGADFKGADFPRSEAKNIPS
jgi:hypothetical protein